MNKYCMIINKFLKIGAIFLCSVSFAQRSGTKPPEVTSNPYTAASSALNPSVRPQEVFLDSAHPERSSGMEALGGTTEVDIARFSGASGVEGLPADIYL